MLAYTNRFARRYARFADFALPGETMSMAADQENKTADEREEIYDFCQAIERVGCLPAETLAASVTKD